MKKLISKLIPALLILCASGAWGDALKSVSKVQIKHDGWVNVDSVGFPTQIAVGSLSSTVPSAFYRDTLTAAGIDTTEDFEISGLVGLSVTFLPVKLVLGTNVSITPQVSDDGVHWDSLAVFTQATSHTVGQTYSMAASATRVVMLAPGLDSLATPTPSVYMEGEQQAMLRTASRLRFRVDLLNFGGTDTTIYKIIVRRQEPLN